MLSQPYLDKRLSERAAYFPISGEHLYTVLHEVQNPVGRVLLVGPLAAERHYSYYPWVRWARYLAARQIEVLRYDYRGIGESTGRFEEMTFADWADDVNTLASWLSTRSPQVPLVLHGLEVGGILASRSFQGGIGDALLLWSPPATANHGLRSSLLLWAGLEQLWESSENRRPASDYIRLVEQGFPIEVYGYQWTSQLWRESFNIALPSDLNDLATTRRRPVKLAKLGKETSPLVKPHVTYDEVKDLSFLYAEHFAWLSEVLALPAGGAA